jgi:serine/threonine-protein kinase ATR
MQVADLRKELCENESGSFSNAQLSEESVSAVKAFRALNLGDGDRPAKRRKKLPESSEDINRYTYEQLVMTLNGSTHDSPVLSLSNLQNIIQ